MFCILPIASDTAYITYSVNSHEDILGYNKRPRGIRQHQDRAEM